MSLVISVILSVAFIVIYSLLIQTFTVLFRITGLSKEKSHFQVISLLTNSGFTTNESELITSNRSRRKIAKWTMIIGTIFNVLIMSLLINMVVNINISNDSESIMIIGYSLLAFVLIMIFIRLPFIKRIYERFIEKIASHISDKKHHKNIITELDSYGKKSVVEVYISHVPESLKNKNLAESDLKSRYDIIILLIQRNGRIVEVRKDTTIEKSDKLVVFGKTTNIKELFDVEIENKEELLEKEIVTNTLTLIDNYGSNAMVEIEVKHVPNILKDKTLSESILKDKYEINIMMIRHDDKIILVDADTVISDGDNIVLFGPYQYIKDIFINEINEDKM